MLSKIEQFRSIDQLKSTIEVQINEIQKRVDEYSKIIGEKIRTTSSSPEGTDISALKEKLDEGTQNAKKKKTSKKDVNSQWFDLNGLYVYNKSSTKGEVELYFKAIEELKTKLTNLQKTKESVESLISKGLKNDVDCIGLQRPDYSYELVLNKAGANRQLFNFRSSFEISSEPVRSN